jgi:hypothetical protein
MTLYRRVVVCLLAGGATLPVAVSALVPHRYWHHRTRTTTAATAATTTTSSRQLVMYFDDVSRHAQPSSSWEESISSDVSSSYFPTYPEQKRLAMHDLLGHSFQTASRLSNDQGEYSVELSESSQQKHVMLENSHFYLIKWDMRIVGGIFLIVEEELLQWAIDTDVVPIDLEEDNDNNKDNTLQQQQQQQQHNYRFDAIADVVVANSTSRLECLAALWQHLVPLLAQEKEDNNNNNSLLLKERKLLHLISFPHAPKLWDYDHMTTLLQAVEFSKPLLQLQMTDEQQGKDELQLQLQLELFHPHYKHAPKMWSPERHAPFPTAGLIVVLQRKPAPVSRKSSSSSSGLDLTRWQLEAIFKAAAATRAEARFGKDTTTGTTPTPAAATLTLAHVRASCQTWMQQFDDNNKALRYRNTLDDDRWVLCSEGTAQHVYRDVWTAGAALQRGQSCMIVAPAFALEDYRLFYRLAISISSALQRLTDNKMRLQVFHPKFQSTLRQSPYAMIQMVHL